ncbi:hypothetical protein BGZ61DRAFT_113123 [Ilyonectria robusta]|uniref:uncharacterized protein n=1 Tax=Ilyonectria robusta TaxID=1079257 RepID=UPI001E8DB414|nr:uncharacterized protein BGZ61DRAFT_113123 [Ilyonectria robusta]KAH8669980.1 hypothetical protein BGZ61DRAFT_113123 [Ilyonectria robusta]
MTLCRRPNSGVIVQETQPPSSQPTDGRNCFRDSWFSPDSAISVLASPVNWFPAPSLPRIRWFPIPPTRPHATPLIPVALGRSTADQRISPKFSRVKNPRGSWNLLHRCLTGPGDG